MASPAFALPCGHHPVHESADGTRCVRCNTPVGVALAKDTDHQGDISTPGFRDTAKVMARLPWYPLVGHREGLRANDLTTLASAFWILAYHSGTATQTVTVANNMIVPVSQTPYAEQVAGYFPGVFGN